MPANLESLCSAFCEEHLPKSGRYADCLICSLREAQAALSRIDYLLSEPNDMEVSPFDLHCSPRIVVERLEAFLRSRK